MMKEKKEVKDIVNDKDYISKTLNICVPVVHQKLAK